MPNRSDERPLSSTCLNTCRSENNRRTKNNRKRIIGIEFLASELDPCICLSPNDRDGGAREDIVQAIKIKPNQQYRDCFAVSFKTFRPILEPTRSPSINTAPKTNNPTNTPSFLPVDSPSIMNSPEPSMFTSSSLPTYPLSSPNEQKTASPTNNASPTISPVPLMPDSLFPSKKSKKPTKSQKPAIKSSLEPSNTAATMRPTIRPTMHRSRHPTYSLSKKCGKSAWSKSKGSKKYYFYNSSKGTKSHYYNDGDEGKELDEKGGKKGFYDFFGEKRGKKGLYYTSNYYYCGDDDSHDISLTPTHTPSLSSWWLPKKSKKATKKTSSRQPTRNSSQELSPSPSPTYAATGTATIDVLPHSSKKYRGSKGSKTDEVGADKGNDNFFYNGKKETG